MSTLHQDNSKTLDNSIQYTDRPRPTTLEKILSQLLENSVYMGKYYALTRETDKIKKRLWEQIKINKTLKRVTTVSLIIGITGLAVSLCSILSRLPKH